MVILFECYLQSLEHDAIIESSHSTLCRKTWQYTDDSCARFQSKRESPNYLRILNKQYPTIQNTMEYEDHSKSLDFLNVIVTSNINDKYEFKVLFKDIIINILHIAWNCQMYLFLRTLYVALKLYNGKNELIK